MSFLEHLLGRQPPDVEPTPLETGEVELFRTPGCVMKGATSWVGGDIVLTNHRLILAPINVNDLIKLTNLGLKIVPIPGSKHVMTVIGLAQRLITQIDTDVAAITTVTIGQQTPSLTRPPSIVVRTSQGDRLELGVLAGRLSPNWSSKNVPPRDHLYATTKKTLGV